VTSSWVIAGDVTPTLTNRRLSTSGDSVALIDGVTPNGTISTWWYPGSATYLDAGLVFRASDAQNFYVFRLWVDRVILNKVQNGVWTQVWVKYLDYDPRTRAHRLEAELSGSTITVNLNYGTEVFTYTDPFNSHARSYGIRWSNYDTTSTYDEFRFTATVPPPAASSAITPANPTIAVWSGPTTLTATAYDAGGTGISGTAFDWVSSNPAIATVRPASINSAYLDGVGTGTVTITATPARGVAATTSVTVTPGAYIAYDSFTGPNGTALTAHAPEVNQMAEPWYVTGAEATLFDQRVSAPTTSTALLEGGTPNVTVEARWYPGTSPALKGGLVFRATDDRNYFSASIEDDRIKIWRVVNSASTLLQSMALDGAPRTGVHSLRAVTNGNTLLVDWDSGARQFQWSDTFNFTATKYGLQWVTGDSTSAFDAFRIVGTPPPAPHHVVVTPATASLAFEQHHTFYAQAYDASNQPMSNVIFNWSTSSASVAQIAVPAATAATVAATGVGAATITATPLGAPGAAASAAITVAPGNNIVYDAFSGPAGMPLQARVPIIDQMGGGWSASGSLTAALDGGRAPASGTSGATVALIDAGTANAAASVNWYAGTAPNLDAGLVFRARDAGNYFLWQMFADRLQLTRVANGQSTELWVRYFTGPPAQGLHTMRVELDGANISLYWDSTLELFTTDIFNINATRYGLRWSFYDTTSTYDYFRVTGMLAPPATRVDVTPNTPEVSFHGYVDLTARAYDAANAMIPAANFTWTTNSPNALLEPLTASIVRVWAMGEGIPTVTATPSRGPSGNAVVTINPGTTLIYDSFAETTTDLSTHMPELTQLDRAWVVPGAPGSVTSDGRATVSATNGAAVALIESGAPDATISTLYRFNGTRAGVNYPYAGVVIRASDVNNYLLAYMGNTSVLLARVTGGSWTYHGSKRFSDDNYLATGQHRLEVRAVGSAIEVWVDGERQIQATDTFNLGASKHGLWWWTPDDRTSTFDDFSVTGALAPVVSTLTVDQTAIAIAPYEATTLTATARDAAGQVIPDAVLTWTSSAPAIASVNPVSLVSGVINPSFIGSTTITAQDVRGLAPAVSIPVTVRICVDPRASNATSVSSSGGGSSVAVSAAATCTWRAVSLATWLTVTGGISGSGNGTVTFSAAANSGFFTRTGYIAAGGRLFSVTQAPQPNTCVHGLSPGQTSFPASGGIGDFGLSADPNCVWQQYSSDPSWVVPLDGSEQGSASPRFEVRPNDTPWERSATVGVAGGGFTITQAGNPNPAPPPSPPPVAPALVGGVVQYYHTDAIGSVRMITNESGLRIERYDYTPFGVQWGSTTLADPRQFAGKERDTETNLNYFGGRYYASQTGRFTTADPALDLEAAILNPQRWNRYAYSLNNPLRYTDPDGRSPKLAILALKAGHALYKGYGIYSTVEGIVDAGGTLISADATGWERLLAAGALAGELSGATDLLKAGKGVMRAVDNAADASRAYRHTYSELINDIKQNGLLRNGEGKVFATPTGGLSPFRAQIELALPGNRMRNVVVKIDLDALRKAGYKIPEPKRVTGQFGRPGGGWEYEFDYDIPAKYLIWE
jgi:RHS repeat-associated protein